MYSKLRNPVSRTKTALIGALLFVFAAAPALPGLKSQAAAQQSASAAANDYQIVALGDSMTAGYELGFTEQSVPYGYVEHVYEQALFHGLRAEYANYGIIGLKTNGLKRFLEAAVNGTSVNAGNVQEGLPDPRADKIVAETKELRASLEQAELVVMTIGGNDLMPLVYTLEDEDNGLALAEAELTTLLDAYESELAGVLRLILKLNPNVQVAISDQYLPIPAPYQIGNTTVYAYPEKNRQFLLSGVEQLKERLSRTLALLAGEGLNVKAVGIADKFAGNELGLTYIAKKDIHPNSLGYTVIGKAYAETIWGDYRTVKPRASDAPLSIVVKGKELATANAPLLIKGRTYLALRDVIDGFGAKLDWNAKSQTATVSLNDRKVDIKIGASTITVNGSSLKLDAQPAFIHKTGGTGKTYVPLAALTEGLGFQVVYRGTLKTIFINM